MIVRFGLELYRIKQLQRFLWIFYSITRMLLGRIQNETNETEIRDVEASQDAININPNHNETDPLCEAGQFSDMNYFFCASARHHDPQQASS